MRSDLRSPDQLRPLRFQLDFLPTAEGSVLIEVGSTRVLCTATLEDTVPSFLRGQGLGWVTAEYSMLPRATLTRTPREVNKGRQSGRTLEIQRLIGRALRSVVDRAALGERTLLLDCDVLQADGGTRTASICGAFVAMAMALQRLVESKTLAKLPLRQYLAATSVGIVAGAPALDLNYEEDSRAEVDMNLVMTGDGRYVEIQATAEHEAFSEEQSRELLRLGRLGIGRIMAMQHDLLHLALPRFA
ncbi:MAG TPA: ribonuclease PH [Terriglobales bacterium]|nr:ribonuclease PH [Terriglobales bacterium]